MFENIQHWPHVYVALHMWETCSYRLHWGPSQFSVGCIACLCLRLRLLFAFRLVLASLSQWISLRSLRFAFRLRFPRHSEDLSFVQASPFASLLACFSVPSKLRVRLVFQSSVPSDFASLKNLSGSLSVPSRFAFRVRKLTCRQTSSNYHPDLKRSSL